MPAPKSDFAGYRIERALGHGAMGDLYLARHPRLERWDALKLISKELSGNEAYRLQFRLEADLACMVSHESVVRVYDRGEDDDRLWLATQYVPGVELAQLLRTEGHLTTERAVAVLEQLAAGLDAIHALGLLHRDVRPANILLTQFGDDTARALLTDLGVARATADSLGLTAGDLLARRCYEAPEQFASLSQQLDRRADVYALGCVFYEMLTGRVPLQAGSATELTHLIRTVSPKPPSQLVGGISHRLDAVAAKALSKRPDDRFSSAGELAQAARAAFVATPTPFGPRAAAPVSPPVASRPAGPPASRNRKPWLIGVGIAVVAAIAVVGVLLFTGGSDVPGVPRDVSTVAGRGTVTIDWHASSGKVDHYLVYRDGRAIAGLVRGVSFTDRLPDTKAHRYTVLAVNAKGVSSGLSAVSVGTAGIRPLDAAETKLLAELPTSLVDDPSCIPILAGVNPNLDIALSCEPKAGQAVTLPAKVPQVVQVFAAADAPGLQSALAAEISSHGAKGGNCANVPEHGTWNFTETPKVANGQIICYRTTESTLIWSYDQQFFCVKILTTATYQSLLAYWEDAALHLP